MESSRSIYLNDKFLVNKVSNEEIQSQKSSNSYDECFLEAETEANVDFKTPDRRLDPKYKTFYGLANTRSNLNKNLNQSSYSLSELDEIKKNIQFPDKTKLNLLTLNQILREKFSKAIFEFNRNKVPFFERLIRKNGDANIIRKNIHSHHLKYMSDLFNTIVDMKWRYILSFFFCCFLTSWTFFAILWFVLAKDCIQNLDAGKTFIDTLMFSIETQQTIGYGYKYVSNTCSLGLFIMMFQCGFSVIFQSLMGGIVFAKLSRPKKRTETLVFSKKACIGHRDGRLCLMVRVGDLRKTHIINAYIRMFLIRTRFTKEGEIIPWNTQELNLSNNPHTSDRLIFMPIIVEHIIDDLSPLKPLILVPKTKISPKNTRNFRCDNFEIVVILEGTVESTGQTTQARTSFLPSEILWNHVFEPLMDTSSKSKATVDFSKFDLTRKLFFGKKTVRKNLLSKIFQQKAKIVSKTNASSTKSSNEKIV
ncbi:G -activated inward rectifier potassium channel 3-like [Brachionus plicatilis]|uniref:G-activated inward rectifier potassium channel 3-like n=1 Tax=Brachionus plicatilis TaxID=10195 RepID=A0A3M7Q1A5_BRAPC|nr:G -activated inward rectifier potassium channel 3-like [Brachionus plicatilis]